jgi:diguanylate cyclase (GGDEF)-like protein
MVLYIGLGVVTINYVSGWMMDKNYSVMASKAKDIAILTVQNLKITDEEVEELKELEFKDVLDHPINVKLADMFSSVYGYDDIQFTYVMVVLDRVKYFVTEEYEEFYDTQVGTPLNVLWLLDVVIGKTREEILSEDAHYYDDIKRYSYLRKGDESGFHNKVPFHEMISDEYGYVICGLAPLYTEEGTFVGMLGVDIYIDEYESNANRLRLLLLIVFLLPSVSLTAVYILLYIMNLKQVLITAQTDPLTSVKNRRFMEKYLSQAIKEHFKKQLPLSVIMIDIDYFKNYNDNYGHQQGDTVLVETTKAIASVLRDNMDVICRYGGEEFLVILSNTNISVADRVADRIKTAVNSLAIKHEYSEVAGYITVSQGIYSAVPSSVDAEKLFIEYADKGMYRAKKTGRNKYVIMR